MQVILLDRIRNLGNIGDKVSVKPGFARNFLIPYEKAVPVTAANMAALEARRAELEQHAAADLAQAQQRAAKIAELGTLTIRAQVSEEGKLYGSVGIREVIDAVSARGCELHKSEVDLPTGPIHEVGQFHVTLHLHTDVDVTLQLEVIAD